MIGWWTSFNWNAGNQQQVQRDKSYERASAAYRIFQWGWCIYIPNFECRMYI